MSTPLRLAVGVCTYNRGPRLVETLESLAGMRAGDGEGGVVTRVVVVDNNCTDGTEARVKAFGAAGRGIAVEWVREVEQGLSAARRRVLEATAEPLVAFVDDDCVVDAGWASACLRRARAAPRAGAIGGRVRLRWERGPTALAAACATQLARQELGDTARRLEGEKEALVGAAIVLRREAVEATGWLREAVLSDRTGRSLVSGGDTELCVRLRLAGWELWYEPAAVVEHLIPPERMERAYLARLLRGIGRSEPVVEWLIAGRPGPEWAAPRAARARRRWVKTALLEWRARRRFVRLNQRAGRAEGWRELLRGLGEGGGHSDARSAERGHNTQEVS